MTTDSRRTNSEFLAAEKSPPRFRLWQLFALIAMASLVLGLFRWSLPVGIFGSYLLLTSIALCFGRISKKWEIAVAIVIGLFLLPMLLPGLDNSPEPSRRMSCSNHLKQIGLALHNYHDDHGAFPPAYVVDKAGKPLYSWRVLLLPYMEQKQLHSLFHLDEPWDSPHNLQLSRQMPAIFRCPNRGREVLVTNYVAIVGEETAWPGAQATTYADFRDGVSKTLHVVEWSESDIVWTEPRDLPMKDISTWWHVPEKTRRRAHRHSDGVHILWCDGRISFASPHEWSATELRSILTRSGGEPAKRYPK